MVAQSQLAEHWPGRYRSWKVTLGMGIAAGVLLEGLEIFPTPPFLVRVLHKQPDTCRFFRALHGNLKLMLIFVALAWTVAAFGEEMAHRGYLMDRVADLLNRTRHAWIISLIAVQVGFGLTHAYQGVTGVIDEALMGLLLGLIYLGTGRNLAVSIVAHGIADTIDFDLFRQISRHAGPASDQCCLVGAQNKRRESSQRFPTLDQNTASRVSTHSTGRHFCWAPVSSHPPAECAGSDCAREWPTVQPCPA
jgi:membrane protease YdiL (CAAX protease family)